MSGTIFRERSFGETYNPDEDRRLGPEIQVPSAEGRLSGETKPFWVCTVRTDTRQHGFFVSFFLWYENFEKRKEGNIMANESRVDFSLFFFYS